MWKAYPRHSVNLSRGCYAAILSAIRRDAVLEGPDANQFEDDFAGYIGVRHALGVSSGRAALYLALKTLELAPGDEIIMPAYTFHIVPLVIDAYGLTPVFVDVLPGSYNMNPDQIEACITPRTRAILATHMYGQPCDMERISAIAEEHHLFVLEDCAHALGTRCGDHRVGAIGDIGLFTFALAKNMPCFGGGMLTTNDDALYEKLSRLIQTPSDDRRKGLRKEVLKTSANYFATLPLIFSTIVYPLMRLLSALGLAAFDSEPGQETVSNTDVQQAYPTRITNLQAAVGCYQLGRIEAINAKLEDNARRYNALLGGIPSIDLPMEDPKTSRAMLYYRIKVRQRQALRRALLKRRIDTMADDMSDCTRLAPFRDAAYHVPVAAALPAGLVEIPSNQHLTPKDIVYIAGCIKDLATP
jgi:dTDP-4-amino-4,6-dideoxygalactose transaminase